MEAALFPSAACVSSGASTGGGGGALPGASVLFPIPRPSAVVLAGGRKSSDVKRGSGLVADGSLLGCLFAAMQWACSCASRTRWSPSYGPEGESGARLSRSSGSSLDVYAQFACPVKAVPGLVCLGQNRGVQPCPRPLALWVPVMVWLGQLGFCGWGLSLLQVPHLCGRNSDPPKVKCHINTYLLLFSH